MLFLFYILMAEPTDIPKLTRNDQKLLKVIIQHAKMPDTHIAGKLGISPQAVHKIRRKLEKCGIIRGYQPVIDFRKLGISTMALLSIRLTPAVWESSTDEQISERIRQIPYVVDAYRVAESDVSHILLMGFRDQEQMDRYLIKMQTRFAKEIELKTVYVFSTSRIITRSAVGLLYEILDKKEFPLDEFFIRRRER